MQLKYNDKDIPVCGETTHWGVVSQQGVLSTLQKRPVRRPWAPCSHHPMTSACLSPEPEPEPETRGDGEGRKRRKRCGAVPSSAAWGHPNGPVVALKCPLQNAIYPISHPVPATQWLGDLLQGHVISLGSSSLSCKIKTGTRSPPKSCPPNCPTVYNPDFPLTPGLVIPSLCLSQRGNAPGSRNRNPSPKGTGAGSWSKQRSSAEMPPWAALANVWAPTVGKYVLNIKQQDNDCRSQRGNLKIGVDLALCGFTSCPETELRAAGGPDMTNISEAGSCSAWLPLP